MVQLINPFQHTSYPGGEKNVGNFRNDLYSVGTNGKWLITTALTGNELKVEQH